VNFYRFQAVIHILTVNCAKIIQDRPGQPAYEIWGIIRRLQRCKVRPLRFNEPSVRGHQIWVPPWKVLFLLLSTNLAREWLQIDTDLLGIMLTSFPVVPTSTTLNDLEPQKCGF